MTESYQFSDLVYLAIELPEKVKMYKYAGDFAGEKRCIEEMLGGELAEAMRKRLNLEYMIASYMERNYLIDDEEMAEILRRQFPAVTAEDMDEVVKTGHADYILRGGKRYYEEDAPANIAGHCGALLRSLHDPDYKEEPYYNEFQHRCAEELMEKGTSARFFRVRLALRPRDEVAMANAGRKMTVHLPVPANAETQSQIRILSASDPYLLSDAAQRTVCMETVCEPGKEYFVEYSYVNRATYHDVKAEQVSPTQPDFCTGEEYPHIRFTPYLRALAKELAGDETNPLLLARRVYDYVTTKIVYSYMRPYCAIENLPEFAALNGRGDCGVQALLFITLCRILGIPARWESGHGMYDTSLGSHDWATYYIAPWGWLRADLSRGGAAFKNGDEFLRNFYFANMDPYRDVTCTEFQHEFDPPKRFQRIDPYDSQDGEIEFEDRGLRGWEITRNRQVLECRKVD